MNLSMRNLHDPTLPEQVARLLLKWQLPGELPHRRDHRERDRLGSGEDVGRHPRLKELGVGIAIDDFGTGYTSLAYLARLADHAAQDRSLVRARTCASDADDAAIVRSIITLGHDLGLEVVAEGVETRETYDQLARLGCDTAQGFWLSRPLPPAELAEWLARLASRSARRRPEPQVWRRRNGLLLRLARDLARLRDRLGEHLARLRADDEDAPVDHERRHAGRAGGLRAGGRGIVHGRPGAIVERARDALVRHRRRRARAPRAPAAARDRSPSAQ